MKANIVVATLGLCLSIGSAEAQETPSIEEAVRAAGATDPETLDLARRADEINRMVEESGIKEEQEQLLERLERSPDPEAAMQEFMEMRRVD
jgi:hypothetical protein